MKYYLILAALGFMTSCVSSNKATSERQPQQVHSEVNSVNPELKEGDQFTFEIQHDLVFAENETRKIIVSNLIDNSYEYRDIGPYLDQRSTDYSIYKSDALIIDLKQSENYARVIKAGTRLHLILADDPQEKNGYTINNFIAEKNSSVARIIFNGGHKGINIASWLDLKALSIRYRRGNVELIKVLDFKPKDKSRQIIQIK